MLALGEVTENAGPLMGTAVVRPVAVAPPEASAALCAVAVAVGATSGGVAVGASVGGSGVALGKISCVGVGAGVTDGTRVGKDVGATVEGGTTGT